MRIRSGLALVLALLVSASTAAAAEYYSNGVIHFEVSGDVAVSETEVLAPEGPTSVVAVHPTSADTASFLSLTIFTLPLQGGAEPAAVVLGSLRRAFTGAEVTESPYDATILGQSATGTQLSVVSGAATAVGRVTAVELPGGTTIVVYEHRDLAAPEAPTQGLDRAITTLAVGPAPASPDTSDGDAVHEATSPAHRVEEHGGGR